MGLGWALMTETLIKWRRDLLYCHPSHNLCPPPHKLCCSSFGDLNSNFLEIKMTYSSKNLSRYMIQKEKKKIKTEVGWNFCQLMKTLDFWALCREIPFWWLLPMCKFFVSYLQFWLCLCLCVCIFLVCLHKKLQCHSGVPRWWIIFNAALKRLKTPSHSTVTLSPQLLTRVYLCPNNLFSGICVSVSVYICSTLNCHAVPANADESVSVSLARRSETITQRPGGARWTHLAILLTYHPHDCQHTLCTWYGIINHQ